MNVLLISQCDKRALTETRRLLDQFAERRGDRTWQTPITQDGLDTLRSLLRKTARKNTAVACHWIRGLDHSELLWVVGDRRRFNEQGAVPTNTTQRDVLRQADENDWHTGEDILLLTTLAALLHDIGKAIDQFQHRLRQPDVIGRNHYRHEWVSLRLFQAFVGQDDDATWLNRLANPTPVDDATWQGRLQRDGLDPVCDLPFAKLPPLARAVGWLVLTHHRLPVLPGDGWLGARVKDFRTEQLRDVLSTVTADWNESVTAADSAVIEPYWTFTNGLPMTYDAWKQKAVRVAKRLTILQGKPGKGDWLANPYVMHVSRLALMLADHHYSSLNDPNDARRLQRLGSGKLFANTRSDQGKRVLNQTLEEHLVGVARDAAEVCHALPRFEQHLPRLIGHKPLKRRSKDSRFHWQDKAADLAAGMRAAASAGGAFIVNMASTGCGKTLANARVMYALAEPAQGMRCTFALGLRTLTLQTGKAFREAAALSEDDVAVRVGGAASRELFEYHEQQAEAGGSASAEPLLADDSTVRFEGNTDAHPLLNKALHDAAVRGLLAAPVLVCTIDHMTPATESQRGGRQIAPMLRLMSSDLVIDELDDFDIDDLPAVARLVHWAGMLGTRVLISSATLPPSLVQGMFDAYRHGRMHFARNRGATPGAVNDIACAWIDEFDRQRVDCRDVKSFVQAHEGFARQRAQALAQAKVRRRTEIRPLSLACSDAQAMRGQFAHQVLDAAHELHARHHQVDAATGKRVSFGLVRMANISPLYDVALAMYAHGAPAGVRVHLCTYHSQYPLVLRSAIERRLDHVLDRRKPAAVFEHPDVRRPLDRHTEPDQLFIVLGSPVTEVGRDHDYDWAVVEPSSMRSLIQLAGRVWRHRTDRACDEPNMVVFDTNLNCWTAKADEPAYWRPGFETRHNLLARRRLSELLEEAEWQSIDARPRIRPRPVAQLRPDRSLVDLEHARLGRCLVAPAESAQRGRGARPADSLLGAFTWWQLPAQDALLTAALPQQQPFRAEHEPQIDLCLRPDADNERGYSLFMVAEKKHDRMTHLERIDDAKHHAVPPALVAGNRIAPWGETDYLEALETLAEGMGKSLDDCALRFGTVTLPESKLVGWHFHPALGFAKAR
jgi:CRISPR-associated endonuclease/helicase Cas3